MKVPAQFAFFKLSIVVRSILAIVALISVMAITAPEVHAQKTEYEKIQQKKNKSNRRLKRRGDKGKSNRAKLRSTRFKIRSKQGERAYKGDITGRKFRSKRSTRPNWGARIARPNPYAGRKRTSEGSRAKALKQTPRYSSRDRERAWKGAAGRASIRRSQRTTFTGKRAYQQTKGSNRSATRDPERPRKVRRIIPRSASGAYRVRRRAKPYAIRERSQWEKAYQGDITGRKFRAKGTSDRPIIQKPKRVRFSGGGGRRGDKAYTGRMQGGYKSISRIKERAWKNDISGNKLRNRTSERPDFSGAQFKSYPKGKRRGDKAYKGKMTGGYKSISSRKERAGKRTPSSRPPGEGTQRGWKFQGNIKSGKPLKGGGSISGKRWNNNGRAVQGREPREQDNRTARFQGNVKGGRPLKGGGSISNKLRNNNGRAIQGRGPREQDNRTARFQGNVKGGRPLKGGGSISDRLRNNKGRAIQGRGPREQDNRTARFQGNIKGGKPLKGGGSISRRWNNDGKPIQGREPREQDNRTARFQGNIKGGKPLKGGGSISRRWNNKERPIKSREPREQDEKTAKHSGNIRAYMLQDGPNDEHKYSGNIRQFDYRKNPNSAKEALKVRPPEKAYFKKPPYQGNIKIKSKIKQNKSAADESLAKKYPKENYFKGGEYQGKIKRDWEVKHNPSSADDALKTRPRTQAVAKGTSYEGRFKMTASYRHNPKAHKESLKGIGPQKAAIQASNYQGNIKMKKKRVEDRHPDFKYLSSKSNGKAEKDKAFSFKLMWSKLFKKSENQPDHLKQKERKPRYDKKESDLWND